MYYFVSYNWSNRNGENGSACTVVEMEEKINTNNIADLHNKLVEMAKYADTVVILNFKLLD